MNMSYMCLNDDDDDDDDGKDDGDDTNYDDNNNDEVLIADCTEKLAMLRSTNMCETTMGMLS